MDSSVEYSVDGKSSSSSSDMSEIISAIEFVDPVCDPSNPRLIKFSDISTAAFNIRNGIARTPTVKSNRLSSMFGMELFLKKEHLQATGSFKERGARFALLRLKPQEREIGVVAASAGNHALALALHGQSLEIPVTVVMPEFAPLMKISSCQTYGANVILHGKDIQKDSNISMDLVCFYSSKNKIVLFYILDNPDVIAGQGTIGLEILEQVDNLDAVIIPVGGGGLIAGIALALKTLKPEIQIIGVESDVCPSFRNAMVHKEEVMHPESSLADGLAVPTVGYNALKIADGLIDHLVSVCEESIALAILRLIEIEKSVVEGAGAVGLAAILSGKVDFLKGKRVVTILTGGNIDTTVLGRTIERGLAVDGRLIKFDVVVSDRPGGIAELTTHIARAGASIKDMFHERAWLAGNVFSVSVRVVAETRGHEHVKELQELLSNKYAQVSFPNVRTIEN
ncbi:pyridoxal-phosphate dependent enzyme domain-containing protein [Ditylenchus destructor]|uniref:Serine racemase n=1 Tax=Ditylenchus destructor TaxID=166010 RepID=A0AAD4MII7_9BILA|nr:pyridoxal-phosphate dependent enzyme domain-containing protein [Ditylenchus destructor]